MAEIKKIRIDRNGKYLIRNLEMKEIVIEIEEKLVGGIKFGRNVVREIVDELEDGCKEFIIS